MVHLDGVVADTRRSRFWAFLDVNAGAAELPNPEALTEYMITLVGCSIGLDGLYHQQTKGNEHKLGSCLV